MVELIALSVVVVIAVLAILFAAPRALADTNGNGSFIRRQGAFPDVLARMDEMTDAWLDKPRGYDILLGIVTIVLLAAAVFLHQQPEMLGGLEPHVSFVANGLAILGLVGLYITAYVNVRRADFYSAEAALIGMSLVGTVLLVLVVAILVV